jgi:uncharacterized hydrophobic protein (TIGR00271 family)
VLQLRVYGDPETAAAVAGRLRGLAGMRHVNLVETGDNGAALVTADVRSDAADQALTTLRELHVPPDDIALVRLDTVGPLPADDVSAALIWTDVLGRARLQARAPARYLVLMAAAGVIAALAVLNDNTTLIVGAMAISPDLLPVTAACTGLVFRRGRLFRRGLVALGVGLGAAGLVAFLLTLSLDRLGLLPSAFSLRDYSVSQTHVTATTILVALTAGIAGMLAVETRASAAVGVAISVATIPATAFIGVALGVGQARRSLPTFGVLGANVGMMLLGGTVALAVQLAAATWMKNRRAPGTA